MAKITNNGRNPLHLPDGTFLPLGEEVEVKGWGKLKSHHLISALVEEGSLAVSDATDSREPEADKEVLFAKLKALGIEAGKNSSLKTLQERLIEAEAKAKEEAIAKLKEKGIDVGDDVTLEELQAELAKQP
ncbi:MULTISPECIES: hypothetical protein [Pseudomonas]|uniref:HeH/LEM domain-containing protein n=1 Tax=Pseudomonas putida S13.1.2 TaxID=1384061 RepID=A0AAU8RT79_PSEPU|nr:MULTISPECIES: hypothetical protein [Pseudomonas]AJQ46431.1 hypothetical protein N805_04015 [Pseudomonas putida S13.1.2]